jgi:hypothetical protein
MGGIWDLSTASGTMLFLLEGRDRGQRRIGVCIIVKQSKQCLELI